MVITYYIKLFCMGADRHNGILMYLLLLVAGTIISKVYIFYVKFFTQCIKLEAAIRGVLCKKVFLEISQNSQESTCARVSFLITLLAWGLFSCEFYEISRNTFFTERLWTTASVKFFTFFD